MTASPHRKTLSVNGKNYVYYSLEGAAGERLKKLPYSLRVLLENLLRHQDGQAVTAADVEAVIQRAEGKAPEREIVFHPARVLMQDFTGVPAVVDLAAMRDKMVAGGADPQKINPLSPVDLVIDHSVMAETAGTPDALDKNTRLEFEQNGERYAFLRWAQDAFKNFRIVPPGTGICHQVNLEYLAKVVWTESKGGATIAYPDTVVGTDSHTTMINGLAVLGWGVGGIEAEAAMLGQPISMLIPAVVGMKLTGAIKEGVTATDLVLRVVEMLRKKGVVDKFVEFTGPGVDGLSLADRATIANMAPEYGATCGFFPVDGETIHYMQMTGRPAEQIALTEAYARAQGLWRDDTNQPVYSDMVELDLGTVTPSLAGPKRPQDRVELEKVAGSFGKALTEMAGVDQPRGTDQLRDGDVVIAAITSCTNTSNPSVMIGAGLLAKKAVEKGLVKQPWVKTSLAPGSQVVADYLKQAGLQDYLDRLGFNLVGFGCTTCIGNSGHLAEPVAKAIDAQKLVVSAVLSSNRNFEGRVHPQVKANYLASPPLVVAYALFGTTARDITKEPLGTGADGKPVYLKDIWPTAKEIREAMASAVKPAMFESRYANVFKGPEAWRAVNITPGANYGWDAKSTYIRQPPYFVTQPPRVGDITGARALAVFGDSVTTDHISPAGNIKKDSPAGLYLAQHGVKPADFNSYGARRGNHEVMMRGTFANGRIKNLMVPGVEGGVTRHQPDGEQMPIYDAAMKYAAEGVPLIVIAGKEYGTGSSRDWAAKGPRLLGVRAAVVESFERIHRSNLIGMGVLPLQFKPGTNRETLKLDGTEIYSLTGLENGITPGMDVTLVIQRADGQKEEVPVTCRINTADEAEYYKSGGILPYVLGNIAAA
ncbi:MAG: aconitate hydratase AcnA [Bdellovibrionales bacterium]